MNYDEWRKGVEARLTEADDTSVRMFAYSDLTLALKFLDNRNETIEWQRERMSILHDEKAALKKLNERYLEVLKYYANRNSDVVADRGATARAALNGDEK